jgi:hypothetical protein
VSPIRRARCVLTLEMPLLLNRWSLALVVQRPAARASGEALPCSRCSSMSATRPPLRWGSARSPRLAGL